MSEIRFTVYGAPRTKKNSNVLARAGRRHVVLPSRAWTKWCDTATIMAKKYDSLDIHDQT